MAALESYTKGELFFVEELPKILEIECSICLQVMLRDPHLVSCCGHHFCGTCITKVRSTGRPCPMCNEKNYQSFLDKNTLRIINGLQVYCTNSKVRLGCLWKGYLKDLSAHLSKGKREGECQWEMVKCRYEKCIQQASRFSINDHETIHCPFRAWQCRYCKTPGTYRYLTTLHYAACPNYPVDCPNKCSRHLYLLVPIARSKLNDHLSNECPLQPVECMFSWAGCTDRPLRKDSQLHTTDLKHMSLLAVACGQLKSENDTYKKDNEKLKEECRQLKANNDVVMKGSAQVSLMCQQLVADNKAVMKTSSTLTLLCHKLTEDNAKLKQDYEEMKKQNITISEGYSKLQERIQEIEQNHSKKYDTLETTSSELKETNEKLIQQLHLIYHPPTTIYPILPVDVKEPEIVHFYTSLGGHLMSIKLQTSMDTERKLLRKIQVKISLAVHDGKFDQFQPKFPMKIEISVNFCGTSQVVPLLGGNSYERLPLNTLSNDCDVTNLSDCKIVQFNFSAHQPISVPIGMASANISAKWN